MAERDKLLYIFALRYAVERRSPAFPIVISQIKSCIKEFDSWDLENIAKEIREAVNEFPSDPREDERRLKIADDFEKLGDEMMIDMAKPQPCWKFVAKSTLSGQMKHVSSEVSEAWVECAKYLSDKKGSSKMALAEELTDVICACTTALQMLSMDEKGREELVINVNEKNRNRGYWEV